MGCASHLPVAVTMAVLDDLKRTAHLIDHTATETTPTSILRPRRVGLVPHRLRRAGGEMGRRRGKAWQGVRDGVPRGLHSHAAVGARSHPRVVVKPPGGHDHPRLIVRRIRYNRTTLATEGPCIG